MQQMRSERPRSGSLPPPGGHCDMGGAGNLYDQEGYPTQMLKRKERPRSGSLPPTGVCDWHGAGNLDETARNLQLGYAQIIEDAGSAEFASWYSHIDSVLFWNRLNWSEAITTKMKQHMRRGVGQILVWRSGSSNNRLFVIKCKVCDASSAVLYPPHKQSSKVDTEILEIFDFLKMERPHQRVV